MRAALAELGVDLDRLRELEPDAALGNGGLGRLAACFMESMASLSIPAYGYGIRYDHGLFRQVIKDGWQQEFPENWLSFGNPWEFERPELSHMVGFGGSVEQMTGADGTRGAIWHPAETWSRVAYDTPVVGWRGRYVNTLRLWSARAPDPLLLDAFNRGDHVGALAAGSRANAISQVLYPSDETPAGQELRLRQEYFFSSASLQDLVRRHMRQHRQRPHAGGQLRHPAQRHPSGDRRAGADAPAGRRARRRLGRGLGDHPGDVLLHQPHPAAGGAGDLAGAADGAAAAAPHADHLPDQRAASRRPGRHAASRMRRRSMRVSLIDEHSGRRVRMGQLAFLGSHRVNGVSALHTELMRQTVFRAAARRCTRTASSTRPTASASAAGCSTPIPGLTELLIEAVGAEVLDDPMALEKLAPLADDAALQDRLRAIRRANKLVLALLVAERLNIVIDPDALFDVQIKRIHEYKRQLLNILQTVALYNAMRAQPTRDWVPRVKIFAGKAAASYRNAKLIIKLIHDVARVINNDPTLRGRLKVVFLPDYNVSLAETIIPAADLSEQISTAGMEASGTGNMKLALNGALTIGTLDGANVEMRDHVGAENMFLFGLTAEEVEERRRSGPPPRESDRRQQHAAGGAGCGRLAACSRRTTRSASRR